MAKPGTTSRGIGVGALRRGPRGGRFVQTPDGRKRYVKTALSLQEHRLHVHPPHEWPTESWNDRDVKKSKLPPDFELHTTQTHVNAERVNYYREKIRAGERPRLLAGRAFGKNWLIDGHHARVAAQLEGVTLPTDVVTPGVGAHLKAPKYQGPPKEVSDKEKDDGL